MGTGRHIQDISTEDFSVAMMVRIYIHLIKVYKGLIRIVVVLWRDFVHYNYCVNKGLHWNVPNSDMYENIPKMHYLDCYNSLYDLQHCLHPCVDLPMLSSILLLDEISWRVWTMHSNNCHCRHDVYTWSYFYMVRLDVRYSTGFLGLEPEHESPH
jgi:hypothetical protein